MKVETEKLIKAAGDNDVIDVIKSYGSDIIVKIPVIDEICGNSVDELVLIQKSKKNIAYSRNQ